MFPNRETAKRELELAGKLNPGPWIEHSENVGKAAAYIAGYLPAMDEEKAYVLGILHDIGRRVGIVNIPKHVYKGYCYMMDKGWGEAAKICMTHSYPLRERDMECVNRSSEEDFIYNYIVHAQYDDYDRLIQLCDSLAADYGFCILEKRFVDVARRYGIEKNTLARWEKIFSIKERFEQMIGSSIYDLLPNIGRTTLHCPLP